MVGALCKKGRGSRHGKSGRLGLWRDSKLYSKYHGKVLKDLKHKGNIIQLLFLKEYPGYGFENGQERGKSV